MDLRTKARIGMLEGLVLLLAARSPDLPGIIATLQSASDVSAKSHSPEEAAALAEVRAQWRADLQRLLQESQPPS